MFLVPIKIDNEYEYCIYGKYESKGQLTLYLKEGNNPKKVNLIHMKTTGKFSWIKVNTVVINKNDGSKHIVGILEDYNEQMDKEEKIKKHIKEISIMDMKNKTDFLTSIFNREGFIQEMNYYLSFEKGTTFRDVFLIYGLYDKYEKGLK